VFYLQALKKKVIYIISASVMAYFYFFFTLYTFVVFAGSNVLVASIWNIAFIIFFIIEDKVETHLLRKVESRIEAKKPTFLLKVLKAYLRGASFKSALYFFYIFISIIAIIVASEPDLIPTIYYNGEIVYIRDYLLSVQHGILLLFATDGFLGQMFNESKKQ